MTELKNSKQSSGYLSGKSIESTKSLPTLEPLIMSIPLNSSISPSENERTDHRGNHTGITDESGLDLDQPRVRTPKFKKIELQLTRQIQEVGAYIVLFNQADGITIHQSAELLAEKITNTCEVDAKFCSTIDRILNASPWIQMISAIGGIGSALLANHGMNPIVNYAKKQAEKRAKDSVSNVSRSSSQ